jgi:hypothetical protein
MEIWLPESFVGGSPGEEMDAILEEAGRLGPDFEEAVRVVEQNPAAFVFWAFDSETASLDLVTNVNVVREELAPDVGIEDYLDLVEQQLPQGFSVTDRDSISRGPVESGRLVIEFTLGDANGKQLQYSFKDPGGTSLWAVNYSAAAEEFDQRLGDFEHSIYTFVILEY